MKKLRNYQIENAKKAIEILSSKKIVYLCMEVRTGKTATAFETAKKFGAKKVLFLTKKKAIDSVLEDYNQFGYFDSFDVIVKNDESMHTITDNDFDLVIHDEHHRCFVGSTLIDGVKIKDIDLGYSLKTFNFEKQEYEYKKVKRVYKNNLIENLIKIKCNGKEIICTESHKIYTKRGWVEAKNIRLDDELQVV